MNFSEADVTKIIRLIHMNEYKDANPRPASASPGAILAPHGTTLLHQATQSGRFLPHNLIAERLISRLDASAIEAHLACLK